jgi:hypothetical protein
MIVEVEGYAVPHYAEAYDSYVLFYQRCQQPREFIKKISAREDRVALNDFLVSGNTVQ